MILCLPQVRDIAEDHWTNKFGFGSDFSKVLKNSLGISSYFPTITMLYRIFA